MLKITPKSPWRGLIDHSHVVVNYLKLCQRQSGCKEEKGLRSVYSKFKHSHYGDPLMVTFKQCYIETDNDRDYVTDDNDWGWLS